MKKIIRSIFSSFQPGTIVTVCVCVLMLGCNNAGNSNPDGSSQSGTKTPDIRLTDLEGSSIDLQNFKGKTLFINFWATWCKPCLKEMPSIERAKQQLAKEEVVFLFASNEEVEEIKNFSREYNYDFRYLRVENAEEIGLEALPTTFIIDPDGKLVFGESGFRQWDSQENLNIIRNSIKKP